MRIPRRRREFVRGGRVWLPAVLALLVAACGRNAGHEPAPKGRPGGGTAAPAGTAARPPGATLGVAGALFTGDSDQIRAYLQTVKEIKPAKFDVQWSPDTVAVSKDEAMRSLVSISRDGGTYRFNSREPVVQRLKAGSILWIYDLAVRRVDRVDNASDITVLYTSPVSLTETFTRADIAFDAAPSLPDYYMGFRPHRPKAPPSARDRPAEPWLRTVSLRQGAAPEAEWRARPRRTLWTGGSEPGLLQVSDAPASPAPDGDTEQDDYGAVRPAGDGFNGTLKGYEYSVGYSTRPDGITLILQARKADDEGGGYDNGGAQGNAAQQLFEIASDALDVRFRIRVDMDNFALGGTINVADGRMQSASAQFRNLRGKVALSFIGRMGKPGNGATKVPLMDVPIMFNIPFPMAGFPFVIQLSTDFNINVFLAGNNAAQKFEGTYEFTGDGGFKSTPSSSDASSTMGGTKPAVGQYAAMSPGVSGAVLGIQAPRIGFGVGVMGASSVAYLDVVHVVTITNAAAVAAGMLAPPCKRITYTAYGHVGVDTKIMPLPIPFVGDVVDTINKKGTTRKEVFKRGDEALDPPVKACEIG